MSASPAPRSTRRPPGRASRTTSPGSSASPGEDVDERVLLAEPPVNESRVRPELTEELKELITVSEWDTMERFGYLAERPGTMQSA